MATIIIFPQLNWLEKLLALAGFVPENFTEKQLNNISLTIRLIRQKRGVFCPSLLIVIIQLLEHDWCPELIVGMLPPGRNPILEYL
jgi:hypothetical protein